MRTDLAKPLFVSVLGWSGSGKTTLIVGALEECRRRGIAAAAAKRARHDADVALEGKDSTRFLDAGAVASVYIGDHRAARFETAPDIQDRAFYESLFPRAQIVFLEGAAVEGALRVLVAGSARTAAELKRPPGECDLLVSADPRLAAGAPGLILISPDAIADFIDFLEAHRES